MEWKTPGVCGHRGLSGERAAPDSLQEPEEDFFTVIAAGNVGTLRQFMKKHRKSDGSLDFDVNCANFQNDNAMTVAVDKSNLEMVKYLAQVMNVTKNSVLLKAIHRGDLDLVRGLCETLNADDEALDNHFMESPCETDHPDCLTPLMLAAIEGHYEIVGYLLDRGHQMENPHRPGCLCKVCRTLLAVSDPLHLSSVQFYTYSAMSNPSYIPYSTADPIHYCFQLHQRLRLLSRTNPPFQSSYNALADEVSQFAASLVSECRTTKEVEAVLKQSQTRQNKLNNSAYPRLLMAINFNQKEFVTEAKVQIFLERKFYGCFEDWVYFNDFQKLYFILMRILSAPIAYVIFLTNPKSLKAEYYAAPVNKMLHFFATYLVFLGVLFMETREPKPSEHEYVMNSIWSVCIFVYFSRFLGLLAYEILNAGPKVFLRQSWNVYDLVMVVMFSLFVAFSISSWVHVRMPHMTSTERKFWSRFDPQLMAEGFLVIATLMAYLKMLFFFQAHRTLGPPLVALNQLTKYFAWFGLFGVIVLFGYSAAFSHFYSYYSGMSYVDPETKAKSMQEESFTDVLSALKTFFWGFFGQSNSSAADVVLENANEHMFTQLIGYAALGSFLVLMILAFKSMLIAMAVKSYQDGGAHKTWLFERTQLFLHFIDSPLLPPPFNLLPHRYSPTTSSSYDLEAAKDCKTVEYKELAKELVERYFNAKLNKDKRHSSQKSTNSEESSMKWRKNRCRSL